MPSRRPKWLETSSTLMSISKNIFQARKNLYMSQTKLASLVGVSPQSVQLWECGKNAPKRSRIEVIATTLKVSKADLEFGLIQDTTQQFDAAPDYKEYINSSEVSYSNEQLNAKERVMLIRFRELDDEVQDHLILLAEAHSETDENQDTESFDKQVATADKS